jgi:glyoxylase-like metal-dependent hydrolase (beta-lactamase superfamily II)
MTGFGAASGQDRTPMVPAGATLQIAPNVYVIPDQRVNLVPNIGIIVGGDGVMVVDTGMGPRNAEIVLAEVRKITDKPIRYLAITHFHPEHGMGAQAFPKETLIVVPSAQKRELESKGRAYIELFSGFGPAIAELLKDVELVGADLAFGDRLEIDLGGTPVHLLHYQAAHTLGDMLVHLPEQGILFCGDLVVNRFFPIMPDADASPLGWLDTLDRLRSLKPGIIVPGHGEVGDATLIGELEAYLVGMRTRVHELKGEGKTLDAVRAVVVPEFEDKYQSWDNPNWVKNAVERFYAEL